MLCATLLNFAANLPLAAEFAGHQMVTSIIFVVFLRISELLMIIEKWIVTRRGVNCLPKLWSGEPVLSLVQ